MAGEANGLIVEQYSDDIEFRDCPVLESAATSTATPVSFDFLETVIEGIDNMNPLREAKRTIFREPGRKQQRLELRRSMRRWIHLLTETNSVAEMAVRAMEQSNVAEALWKGNLKKVLEAIRDLEQSYRAVQLFFKNAEASKLKNVVFVNAPMHKLTDLEDPLFIEDIARELKNNYDRLDLRHNYSLMVIPGYLKSNVVLNKWAKMAYENKVMLITDFVNAETPDDVLDLFSSAELTSADPQKANVIMTCNYIVGRGKNVELGEQDDIYIPGSAALSGKMYCTKLSQPVAGKTYGMLEEVQSVRFDQQKADISLLEDAGLVPIVGEWGRVMPFSAKTLFTGDNLGMKTYSVVRVFDFIAKVLSDFLNRRAFELWNSRMEKNLRSQIVKFLDGIQGPDKLIEKFQIIRFERDEAQKDRIYVDIHITPFFPAKSFLVKLDGYKGDDGEEWKAEFRQQ